MKRRFTWTRLALAALMFWLSLPPQATACATCFGKSDSKLAEGLNNGIFALLGLVLLVLGWLAGFFFYVSRRSRREALSAEVLSQPANATHP